MRLNRHRMIILIDLKNAIIVAEEEMVEAVRVLVRVVARVLYAAADTGWDTVGGGASPEGALGDGIGLYGEYHGWKGEEGES